VDDDLDFKVGDIVTEQELIVPSDRQAWNGIVLSVEKSAWIFSTIYNSEPQDRVIVMWLANGLTEELPSTVLLLHYRAEQNIEDDG